MYSTFEMETVFFICLILFFFYLTISVCREDVPKKKVNKYVYNEYISNTDDSNVFTSRNAFTGLLCVNDDTLPVITTVDNTIACLKNPDTNECYKKSELVPQSVGCNPPDFSAALVKQLNDMKSTTRTQVFPKLAKYDLEKCTPDGLNDSNHWCGKTYNNLMSSCIPRQLGTLVPGQPIPTLPAGNWCGGSDSIKKTAQSAPTGSKTNTSKYCTPTDPGCTASCLRQFTRNARGKIVRFSSAECKARCENTKPECK
jgi:hypothetical protein